MTTSSAPNLVAPVASSAIGPIPIASTPVPRRSARDRAAVTTSYETFLRTPSRCSRIARTPAIRAPSLPCAAPGSTPAHPPRLALRRQHQFQPLKSSPLHRYRLHLERLLLGRHNALERRIAGLVQPLVGRQDGGQRELHHFHPTFHLPLSRALPVRHR